MSSNDDNSGKKCASGDNSAQKGSSSEKLAKKMEPATVPSDIKRGSSADSPSLRLTMSATVVKGFGRGSKLLGIPTANMAMKEIGHRVNDTQTGIYFGYTMLRGVVYQAVVSIGWNPYFDNREKTVEPHLLHKFEEDFYGEKLHLLLCGFIRNELNFKSLYDLIEAIGDDIKYARKKFEEPEVASLAVDDPFWAEVIAIENATPPESDVNPTDADDVPPAASASASSTSTPATNSSSNSDSSALTSVDASVDKTVEISTKEGTSTDSTSNASGGSDGKTDGSTGGDSASTGNGSASTGNGQAG